MLASNPNPRAPVQARPVRKRRTPKALRIDQWVKSTHHEARVLGETSNPHTGFIAAIYSLKTGHLVRWHYWESSLQDVLVTLDARI